MPTLKINSISVTLPYSPYPAQLSTISKIIQSLQTSSSALIQSPTGTGKSLAILCGTLAFLKETKTKCKIYICTRTHKQIDQMIEQLRKTVYKPSIAILASRQLLCINPLIRDEKDKNKACTDLIKKNSCTFFLKKDKLQIKSSLYDIEEIRKEGKKCGGCPFYATRSLQESADVIFAPYNYIIDPAIREAMSVNLNNSVVIVDEAHNIEDFCRSAGSVNLEKDALEIVCNEIMKTLIRGFKSEEVKKDLLAVYVIFKKLREFGEAKEIDRKQDMNVEWKTIDKEINMYDINKANTQPIIKNSKEENIKRKRNEADAMLNAIKNTKPYKSTIQYKNNSFLQSQDDNNKINVIKGKEIITLLEQIGITQEKYFSFKAALHSMQKNEEFKDILALQTLNLITSLALALETILLQSPDSYVFVNKKHNNNLYTLSFWLLDPSVIFKPIAQSVRSIILLSGTLTPFKSFSSELGHNFKSCVEAQHVVNKKNVFIGCIKTGHLGKEIIGKYSVSDSFEYLDQVKDVILNLRQSIKNKGGTLVFVPSYVFLENLTKRFKHERYIMQEPKNGAQFEAVFTKYKKSIDRMEGPILFCVYRGRASEGIDFKDNFARAVIAVGIPYPSYKDLEVVCKREYNDMYKEVKGQVWYEIQAYRAVNQAIGRVLRHKEDWGGVFLVDSRYAEKRSYEMMPQWVQENYKVFDNSKECYKEFETFLQNKK